MAARLKDIARDVGVSTVTVSKVLRNHPDIGEETRERILRRMKELNYQPNLSARALVTGRTSAVGLIVPDLVHPFFAEVAKGLAVTLRDNGYDLMIASSEENAELENKGIEQMLARRVDALILASSQHDAKGFSRLEERKTPFVLIDRELAGLHANFVGINDEKAGFLATNHLLDAGCTKIAHIQGPDTSTAKGRAAGYERALRGAGIEPTSDFVVVEETGDDSGEVSGYGAMVKLLQTNAGLDGVFCYNDPSAMGAMQAILDAGLRIPEDIAIIGCGNVRYAGFLRVPLSSIDQKCPEIGAQAGTLALTLIQAKTPPKPVSIILEPSLAIRASTGRAARLLS